MNIRQKIYIDEVIAKPLVLTLNLFVRLAGKLLKIDHSLEKDFKTIAIAKYKGMGSIIQSTPLLQTLRLKYPKAHIVFVTTRGNVAILKKISCIDEIVYIDDKSFFSLLMSFIPFVIRLIRLRIELYLDLEIYSNFSSLITTVSLAKNRIGYFLRSSNYRLGIYTHMMYYNIRVPVSQTYLQFSRLLNCEEIIENLYCLKGEMSTMYINGKLINLAEEKYILINPNASDLRLERRWDRENYTNLIGSLQEKYPDFKLFLIGGKDEASYVAKLYSSLCSTQNMYNMAGKTSVDQLISLVKYATLFITNDTGPMHIGYSVGTKMVALYGPCSPEQYGMNKGSYNIYHKVYCSPCVHEFIIPPCGGDNQCMKLIEVAEVLNAVDKALFSKMYNESFNDSNIYEVINDKGAKYTLGVIKRN